MIALLFKFAGLQPVISSDLAEPAAGYSLFQVRQRVYSKMCVWPEFQTLILLRK